MTNLPDPLDDELHDLLWRLYERRCVDLEPFKDHPAYGAVAAQLCAQRVGLALGSLELLHVTGVYKQPCWVAGDEEISELYELLTLRRFPDLGL